MSMRGLLTARSSRPKEVSSSLHVIQGDLLHSAPEQLRVLFWTESLSFTAEESGSWKLETAVSQVGVLNLQDANVGSRRNNDHLCASGVGRSDSSSSERRLFNWRWSEDSQRSEAGNRVKIFLSPAKVVFETGAATENFVSLKNCVGSNNENHWDQSILPITRPKTRGFNRRAAHCVGIWERRNPTFWIQTNYWFVKLKKMWLFTSCWEFVSLCIEYL